MGISIQSVKSLQSLFSKPKLLYLSDLGRIYKLTRKLIEMLEYPPWIDDNNDVQTVSIFKSWYLIKSDKEH